jgi:AraC-like DNA-binding protein
MGLPGVVQDLGYDPRSIFASEDFRLEQFWDPDAEISYVAASKLLARCVAATGCAHLGLLLGERASPSSLGIAGFMLQAAPDVGTALRDLVCHLDLHDRGALASLSIAGRMTYLGYAIHLAGVEATDQIYDLAMAVVCQIMRGLCGSAWTPQEVLFSHQRPKDPEPYRQFFGAPLLFDADQSAVAFPTRWLEHPIASADPLLHRHLEREADELHATQPTGVVDQLRRLLRRSLVVDNSEAPVIARQLGMHVRTLSRRLRAEGTSFRRELDDIRYEVARQMLADTMLPLPKIGMALGYADSTAFIRAFKRWSGASPAAWRKLQRRSQNAFSSSPSETDRPLDSESI